MRIRVSFSLIRVKGFQVAWGFMMAPSRRYLRVNSYESSGANCASTAISVAAFKGPMRPSGICNNRHKQCVSSDHAQKGDCQGYIQARTSGRHLCSFCIFSAEVLERTVSVSGRRTAQWPHRVSITYLLLFTGVADVQVELMEAGQAPILGRPWPKYHRRFLSLSAPQRLSSVTGHERINKSISSTESGVPRSVEEATLVAAAAMAAAALVAAASLLATAAALVTRALVAGAALVAGRRTARDLRFLLAI